MSVTPGPWVVGSFGCVVNPELNNSSQKSEDVDEYYGGLLIAETIQNPADCRLIAAAPELLAACKLALERLTVFLDAGYGAVYQIDALTAAIEKAEGKSN